MNQIWINAAYQVESAWLSHHLVRGVKIDRQFLHRSVMNDMKKAKTIIKMEPHYDPPHCLCYHRAIIEMGASRFGNVDFEEMVEAGMKILQIYRQNLS